MKLNEPLVGERIAIRNYRKSDLKFLTDMWFDEENGKGVFLQRCRRQRYCI